MRFPPASLVVTLALVFPTGLPAADAPSVARLEVAPPRVELHGPSARHGLLVTAVAADGSRRDVTREAKVSSRHEQFVAVTESGECRAVAEGDAEILVEYGGQQATVPVAARGAGEPVVPSFTNDVLPVLTRYGCNQGACHGKQAGQNGFRLSLRGYAPEWDYNWLTREFQGRRIDAARPEDSLLVRKPLGVMPHGGGRLFAADSHAHRLLREWIAAGAPGPKKDDAAVTKLEVLPGGRTLGVGDEQQLLVRAQFSDGRTRDVTWLTQFFSNDASVVEVSASGLAKALRPGETPVRVHFQGLVEVVVLTIPYDATMPPESLAQRNNDVDRHVFDKLAALHIPPSPLCDDATFLRRAMLDTIGTLPTPEEARAFLADTSPDKRARLVDELLNRPEFVDFWTLQLADLFQNRRERDHDVRGVKGVRSFHAWLRRQVAANRPWNELARDVLTATGDSAAHPEIGYYVVTVGEQRQAEQSEVVASVAQSFLGTRIGCAKCHNHPLEKYTQDDYYHFAAYFSRVSFDRKNPNEGATELIVAHQEEMDRLRRIKEIEKRLGELAAEKEGKSGPDAEGIQKQIDDHNRQLEQTKKELAERQARVGAHQPRTGEFLKPQPLDRSGTTIEGGRDPRAALADWITDPRNEAFSGNVVNRLWKHFLGVGLVEPVDDLRASNPPSNPELWKYLNHEFVSRGFDVKHLMRLILTSRTYQLSAATLPENARDQRFYSHYYARRLPSEVLLDAISRATGVPDRFSGYPVGMRAIQVPDPGVESYFLSLFGRSERVTACACERSGEVTLPQLLHLQTGDTLSGKIRDGNGRLAQLLKNESDDGKLVEALYLTAFSRPPTADEATLVRQAVGGAENREQALVDVMWALLNTKEFAFNH